MLTPEECAARVHAAQTADGRLPVPAQAGWEVFPFEEAAVWVLAEGLLTWGGRSH